MNSLVTACAVSLHEWCHHMSSCPRFRRLYTLDGQPVLNADDMKSGDMFVAAGREIRFFRKLPYGCNKPAFNNSPKQQPR